MVDFGADATKVKQSEGADDDQNNDRNRRNTRDFVEQPERPARSSALPETKFARVIDHPHMKKSHRNDAQKFQAEPCFTRRADIDDQYQSQRPDNDHRGVHDDRNQPRLTMRPQLFIGRTLRRFLMIDQKTGQHEQTGHPENHEDDMCRLDPQIGGSEHPDAEPVEHDLSAPDLRQDRLDMGKRRIGHDAMPEIEDVRTVDERL